MNISEQKKKKPRRLCGHCDNELCHSAYFEHKKRYFINGVWERKFKRARLDTVKDPVLSNDDTGRAEEIHPLNDHSSDNGELHNFMLFQLQFMKSILKNSTVIYFLFLNFNIFKLRMC